MATLSSLTSITLGIDRATRRLGRTWLALTLLWTFTLWWGERHVYSSSVSACDWHNWESWSAHANPHHVLFVADPQLVDPHTYPDRPWPLSTLTVLYTDLYMRRVYSHLLAQLQPHSTIFLGDLFDGGREWATADYKSPIDRYKKYGTNFWLKEYSRFMNLFIGGWYSNRWNGYLTGEGRRIIASLPGNHDLGMAGGIDEHVRDRFEAHFGPTNRIDILGNHTFVTLDTVSLSAMDQVDPKTGSFGAGDGTAKTTKHMDIWKPVEGFLLDAKDRRDKAIRRRYEYLESLSRPKVAAAEKKELYIPEAKSLNNYRNRKAFGFKKANPVPSANFPTIVMSHVPLWRENDVTCGPYREHGRSIPIQAGYQYQNVLTPAVSNDIVEHLDAEQISMIYSGDDHDYCDIQHQEFTGQIREITVKSISWAMGVRIPGVQLASLWNPIDMEAIRKGTASTHTPQDTIQNRLCLLPDQLAIFIRYAQMLALTVGVLFVRAVRYDPQTSRQLLSSSSTVGEEKSQPLLPLSRKLTPTSSPRLSPVAINSSTPHHTARARSNGKLSGYGNLPSSSRSASPTKTDDLSSYPGRLGDAAASDDDDDWKDSKFTSSSEPHSKKPSYHSSSLLAPPSLPQHRRQQSSLSSLLSSLSSSLSSPPSSSKSPRLLRWVTTPASSRPHELLRTVVVVALPVLVLYVLLILTG